MVHFVLEYLGEQGWRLRGIFLPFRYKLPRSLFRLLRLRRKHRYAKTALLYGLFFLRNFRDFGIYENTFNQFVVFSFFFLSGFLLILLGGYYFSVYSFKTIKIRTGRPI